MRKFLVRAVSQLLGTALVGGLLWFGFWLGSATCEAGQSQQPLCLTIPDANLADVRQAAQLFNARTGNKLTVEEYARAAVRFLTVQELVAAEKKVIEDKANAGVSEREAMVNLGWGDTPTPAGPTPTPKGKK